MIKDKDNESLTIIVDGDKSSAKMMPDISYEKFEKYMFSSGVSDMEFDKYLRSRSMVSLSDFNRETTPDIEIVYNNIALGRVIKLKVIYDSDNDDSFE